MGQNHSQRQKSLREHPKRHLIRSHHLHIRTCTLRRLGHQEGHSISFVSIHTRNSQSNAGPEAATAGTEPLKLVDQYIPSYAKMGACVTVEVLQARHLST
jgi:hypothetical protein